jgi:Phage endonuclease I
MTSKILEIMAQRKVYNKKKRIKKSHKKRVKTAAERIKEREYYASGFESRVAKSLEERKVKYLYEPEKIEYMKLHTYTPDFKLPNGIYIETKGRFMPQDRSKHLLVKAQHPDLDIRFVFMRDQYLNKGAKTKYSDWCAKYHYKYSIGGIPDEWL